MSKIIVEKHRTLGRISKYIYGQFSEHIGRCIHEGLWVGSGSEISNINGIRTDVVEALKEIKVPVLRWPGGCFADAYHWRDGIGIQDERKRMINTNWGGVVENNHFGTHEFFELCRQIGADAYINGNLGSGTVREMSEWVEYMTSEGVSPMSNLRAENGQVQPWKLKFFGIGNESWGCGGNMRAEHYADLYRQYQTFIRNYNPQAPVYKIAVGPSTNDYDWMDKVLKISAPYMDGISLHHYAMVSGWEPKGKAVDFPEKEWYSLIASAQQMDEFISKHSKIMDKYDPEKKIGLVVDEWGSWLAVEPGTNPGFLYQQNTIRDAMVAAVTLHIFQKHVDRVKMANIAQMVNVLQSMILTDGDKMIKTPTYYVFKMFLNHQNSIAMNTIEENLKTTTSSVSKQIDGYLVSLCNFDVHLADEVSIEFDDKVKSQTAEILTATTMDAHNDFDIPDEVCPKKFNNVTILNQCINLKLPPMSIVTIHVQTN